ncbi:hypothetical protein C8R44DRAFT_974870 [Mycena epipterygia]|nr:hypothetical protein C8R44DRAFT_974870 [Mycena epipterygia]
MLWASKRRKSRPDLDPKTPPQPYSRRSSLGNTRLPFAPLANDMPDPKNLYGRPILSLEEQQRVARQNEMSPPPNFSLPRRDVGSSSSRRDGGSSSLSVTSSPNGTSSSSGSNDTSLSNDMIYTTNSLSSFVFGPATEPPPSPGRNIGPLDEFDEDDMRRRADETPRQSLAASSRRDPRTPQAYYSPSRDDAASHHTFGTDSVDSRSNPSRDGSRSRTTSSTTHTSIDDYLGGVTFNPMHHHPTLPPDVEFDSEEDEFSEEYDVIEVSSARGAGSIEGAAFEAAFERQMYSGPAFEAAFERQLYSDPLTTRRPSLPMAIPGVPLDDAPARRDREGSLATLRRPSRSLDDQVSILTVGAPTDPANGPVPAATPVSVPGSDGDWRSLSARHRPASPSVPTFATPAPPSVDGFGFDLDWSTMQAGITGLDMSDVAVHARASRDRRPSQLSLMLRRPSTASGGSVMYDPDTFSAAVRGWGGEEYERQRKYWTFRRDAADGRGGGGGGRRGAGLSPVRSITGGKVGGRGTSILSGVGGGSNEPRPKHVPWKGMQLNAEEIWNSSLVGSFKVRRIELRPQKPQQRVTIDPFRGPYTLGPKPPHDGAYTNIHKHSKVMAFSIHRHYKPTRAPGFSASGTRGSISVGAGARGSVSTASGRVATHEERRRPTAMILLAPRHVQEAYTSTNTTKGLRSHGLLDEGRDRDRERERSTGRDRDRAREKEREKEKERERERARQNGSKGGKARQQQQQSSTGSVTGSTSGNSFAAGWHTYPPGPSDAGFASPGPNPGSGPSPPARRRRRDSLDDDDDDDSDKERALSSRTTHNEAFSTMDASSIDQMVQAQDARYGDGANGVLSRVLRRAAPAPAPAPHSVYIPPWVTLQSRVKQEERRRRHDVLSNSFEDVGLLPPKKSSGGGRARKAGGQAAGVDIFAQVPADALFMLLPLWPGPTDPVSERTATRAPHEIPTEQRQYLLVSYKPTDERAPARKHEDGGRSSKKDRSSHSSPTSSGDAGSGGSTGGKGCDILLSSYHISARLVSHADLQGSGVRVPDEGLAVLGPWHEAWLSMPQIATRDHGLLVIGTCVSREAGVEFDPEGLVKMGLCIPVPQDGGMGAGAVADELQQEEPVAELTPIGKAVLEMAWIGCIAVTSFGLAGSS